MKKGFTLIDKYLRKFERGREMTVGGWICMTFAFAAIGGLFGWCCWKMCDSSDSNDEVATPGDD